MLKKIFNKINNFIQWTKNLKQKKILVHLWQNHKFLFIALIISFILALFQSLVVLTDTNVPIPAKLVGFLFIIPVLLVIIITFIATKTFDKHPNLTKFFTFLINSFVILFIQLMFGMYFLFFFTLASEGKIYDNPKEYSKALKSIYHVERIVHFPITIPKEAKNIELNKETNAFFGSEAILLKFDIDKEFIEQELSKHNYICIEKPNNYTHEYRDAMLTNNGRISVDNYIFYVINDKKNENNPEYHFPYHYGIGVNNDMSSIIYYYVNPD